MITLKNKSFKGYTVNSYPENYTGTLEIIIPELCYGMIEGTGVYNKGVKNNSNNIYNAQGSVTIKKSITVKLSKTVKLTSKISKNTGIGIVFQSNRINSGIVVFIE